jgi:mRNA interferase MazF
VTYSRWQVIVVDFPFVEGTEAKRRPALIVSSDAFSQRHGVYWAAMITTAKTGVQPDDIRIADPAEIGLPENCVIRLSRLFTVNEGRIARGLRQIKPTTRNAVVRLLKLYLPT